MRCNIGPIPVALAAVLCCAAPAVAQLRDEDALLIYDSRTPDSLAVAEFYAGSRRVPGGMGNQPGVHPAVRVLNLATTGVPASPAGNISYANFIANLRTPIRAHLTANNLTTRIRCLILTKGLPHRVQDTDVPNNADFPGDGPGQFLPELTGNDCTSASVESELTLLWQDLTSTEAGNASDSRADGVIFNPYSRNTRTFFSMNNQFILNNKPLTSSGTGPTWQPNGAVGSSGRLNPGDILLTARLDADTVADVQNAILRAQNLLYSTATATVLLDEDGSNLDNIGATFAALNAGNDYELTQTAFLNDGRFRPAPATPPPNILYNNAAGAASFYVGPNLTFTAGQGILVTTPVILLATYGSNHSGVPTLSPSGTSAGTVYATSFNYANGAIFNTIESFNARDYGGLGQLSFAPQQQSADFLGAHGTFAVGNVWEPLADSIPDNKYLTDNFILGNLCWAEAAWTAIPGLSWMQTAVGDPLARASRTTEDIDASLRVNVDDLHAWQSLPAGNANKDVNRSGTADTTDRTFIAASVRATERAGMQSGR
ncbi:MAG TPA: hypothetical protein VHN77_12130 [Phycisphaerales bacterium]|nr:hypothetical protein [Phycisphaerales bacterium]